MVGHALRQPWLPAHLPDAVIQCCLSIKRLFGLVLRQSLRRVENHGLQQECHPAKSGPKRHRRARDPNDQRPMCAPPPVRNPAARQPSECRLDRLVQPPMPPAGVQHEDTRWGLSFSNLSCARTTGSIHTEHRGGCDRTPTKVSLKRPKGRERCRNQPSNPRQEAELSLGMVFKTRLKLGTEARNSTW